MRDVEVLQELNMMNEWAVKWLLEFNVNKCSALHIGKHNTENRYTLDRVEIGKWNSQKDIGVLVSHDVRPRE